jgi:hypothetical protein
VTRAVGFGSPIVSLSCAWAIVCAPVCCTARAQTDAEEEARTFYYQGLEHFNLGEYEAAIEAFTRAYRAVQDPELLFNIAQSHRHLGGEAACRRAAELFTNYRRSLAPGEERPDVDALIAEMEECARPVEDPQPGPAPPLPMITHDEQESPSMWPMWLTIGGAVVAATGGALVWSISWADGCAPRCSPDLIDELRLRMWIGYGLVAAGGVAAAVGLAAWILQPSDSSARAWWAPTPSGVVAGGAF